MFIKQISGTLLIVFCTIYRIMTGTIQLNTQFHFRTIKVKNIWSNAELPTKFESKYLPRLYAFPQNGFSRFAGFT